MTEPTLSDAELTLLQRTAPERIVLACQVEYVRADLAAGRAELEAAVADAERWRWAREILAGADSPEADAKAMILATGLLKQRPIEETIDAAIRARKGAAHD